MRECGLAGRQHATFYRAALQLNIVPNYFLKYGLIVHIYLYTYISNSLSYTYIGNFI